MLAALKISHNQLWFVSIILINDTNLSQLIIFNCQGRAGQESLLW